MLPRRPAKKIWNKKKRKKKKPSSRACFPFPSDASFFAHKAESAVDHPTKKEIRGSGMFRFTEQTFRPDICAVAGLVWHDEQGLSSISSSPDPGSSCQSMHKSSTSASPPPPFTPPEHMQQADTQRFTQNRCKHSHTCQYTYET